MIHVLLKPRPIRMFRGVLATPSKLEMLAFDYPLSLQHRELYAKYYLTNKHT